jgi:hypothetical protein
MAAANIMICNIYSVYFLALQICRKKELRPLALCLMAAGHIMIYNIYSVFFFIFTNLS